MLLNILNAAQKQQHTKVENSQQFSSYFQKIVNFIQWSQFEDEVLQKFEHILQIQLQINRDELIEVLTHFKIDHELTRALMKMCEEIESNLIAFCQSDVNRCQDGQESSALNRVNLLIRTSTTEVKCLCQSLTFLHFASSNMDYYNRIIHWFEKKDIYNKLCAWKEVYSTVLKQKVLSVICILYIKYEQGRSKSQIILAAIQERQKYLQYRNQLALKGRSRNLMNSKTRGKSVVRFYDCETQSQKMVSLLSESILDDHPIKNSTKRSNNSRILMIKYEIVTIYFRYKLIEALVDSKKRSKQGFNEDGRQKTEKNAKNWQSAQKYYQILTLIHKFKAEVKAKCQIFQLKTQIQFFESKTNQFQAICENKIKQFDDNLYLLQSQQLGMQQQKSLLGSKDKIQKIGRQGNGILKKHSLSAKGRSGSLQVSYKSENKRNLKQELSQLYFKQNYKTQDNRDKTKSCKILIRDRSKSKVMAKILANTFENAKNALRQIQFQMKTNNFERFQKIKQPEAKSKLTRHKKTKHEIYNKLNQNNRVKANVCKTSLIRQIEQLRQIVISNPYTMVEQNKKCIIQHKVSHKTQQQTQMLDSMIVEAEPEQDNQNGRSETQSRLQFIKYLDKIPYKIVLKIKPKDKNYLVQLAFNPPKQSEFSLKMSLPKSNNIYTDRYHTIWPTIKYLLRKKMLQYPVIRQNQNRIFETRLPQEQKHVSIKQEKLIELFGAIEEDQLFEISNTLTIICKFFNLLLYSKLEVIGRKYEVSEFQKYFQLRDVNILKSEHNEKKTALHLSSKTISQKSAIHILNDMKRNMWLTNSNEIYIGSAIIKQRSCKFMCFQSEFVLPFYIFELVTYTGTHYRNLIEDKQLRLELRIIAISSPANRRNKQQKPKKTKKYLHTQKVVLNRFEMTKYQIDTDRLTQKFHNTVNGETMDRQIQQKLMQTCWLKFSKFEDFYKPSFFQSYYPEISQPLATRVISDYSYNSYKLVDYDKTNEVEGSVKICENFLDFNVDDLFQNSFHYLAKQNTHRTIKPNKNSLGQNQLIRMPSINNPVFVGTSSLNKTKKINNCLQKNTIRSCLYRSTNPQDKQVVEFNFLTPFKLAYNWIIQISILNLAKRTKNKIVLTAEDFYSLGYPYIQNEQDTLKQIHKLCKLLEVNRSTPIPKVIISLKFNDSKNLIPESNKNTQVRSSQANVSIDRQNTVKQNEKYRSIYHNRAYKPELMNKKKCIGSNKNSLSQIHTEAYIKQTWSVLKRKLSNQSNQHPFNSTCKSLRSVQHMQSRLHPNHHKIAKSYLVKMPVYKWHICTTPVKFCIRGTTKSHRNSLIMKTSSKNSQNIFALIHMNYLNMSPSWQKECGYIQFQLALSQIEYTLTLQLKQQQFFSLIQFTHPKMEKTIKNILSTLHTCQKQAQKWSEKPDMKQKNKGLKRFSSKEKKHFMGLIQLIYLQATRQKSPKSQQELAIDLINEKNSPKQQVFDLNTQKQHVKQFLRTLTIKQNQFPQVITNPKREQLGCSYCSSTSQTPYTNYIITINSNQFQFKARVHHEYDATKQCLYDIYLHVRQWRVSAGLGKGMQIEIGKIKDDDHLQLVKLSKITKKKKKSNKNNQISRSDNATHNMRSSRYATTDKFKPNTHSSSSSNSNTNNNISMNQPSNISEQYIKQQQHQYEEEEHEEAEVAAISLNQLIKQYREEQVDPVYQLKSQVNKNTILLSKLVGFMMAICVYRRGVKDNRTHYTRHARY